MEFRHLGRSGLKISEIAYGNWITHGSQVEEDAAKACVAAALDEGITTFDTADVYAGTRAEEVLGRALHGIRRESVEIFTKAFWPTGSGVNDLGLVMGLAMVTVLAAGALGGILIPLLLTRLGVDPAVSSGPFVTTVTDVVGFLSFLGIATLWFGLN